MKTKSLGLRDFTALILIPLQLAIGWLFKLTPLSDNQNIGIIVSFILPLLSVCMLIKVYGATLKKCWLDYRKKIWLKVLFSILGAIVIVGILQVVRLIMAQFISIPQGYTSGENETAVLPLILTILASLIPLLNAFQEEIIFRHVLFYKQKDIRFLSVFLFLLSAFLFGLIHLNNFDGNIVATIPYMIIGAFLNLVYLFSKNIWYPIGMHITFNFAMATVPMLFISVMQI